MSDPKPLRTAARFPRYARRHSLMLVPASDDGQRLQRDTAHRVPAWLPAVLRRASPALARRDRIDGYVEAQQHAGHRERRCRRRASGRCFQRLRRGRAALASMGIYVRVPPFADTACTETPGKVAKWPLLTTIVAVRHFFVN